MTSPGTPSDDTRGSVRPPLAPAGAVRVLLSTAPPGKARKIAGTLVEEGLAACVNLVPGLRSVYRWQGSLCDEPETLMVLKTTEARIGALASRLGELHPYEVPELLEFEPRAGLPGYLAWVAESGAPDTPPPA